MQRGLGCLSSRVFLQPAFVLQASKIQCIMAGAGAGGWGELWPDSALPRKSYLEQGCPGIAPGPFASLALTGSLYSP